ncbi:DUF1707 SHOCT-like domain-containing protein [Microlunatus antarcticus]|uniref:DUF1707 domain-containing protein n=1 Tax=Microlunatus antarcticus TaxID=53388 RepID=A0A7W5JRU2_9ACTN|nr:hypothetical protein [Microlunatus antarcticus]
MTEQGQPRPQRIGDAERDSAAELLREHMAQGRLSPEEFDERIGAALQAKVASDLDPLFTDLPGPRPGQTVATTPSYETPPWQRPATPAPTDLPTPAVLPPRTGGAEALRGLTGALWIVIPLAITFIPQLGWPSFWWLIFIPTMISMVLGKSESDRDRERKRIAHEQERLDKRRRALGD